MVCAVISGYTDSAKPERMVDTPARLYAISRIQPKPGVWCWQVAFRRRGRHYYKSFYDIRRGGPEKSLAAAIAWRDAQLAKAKALGKREFCQLLRTTNTSGVPGVLFVRPANQPEGSWQARIRLPGFKAHEQQVTMRVAKLAKVETLGALLFMIVMFSAAWAFAWYIHIIGPWVDNLLGLGPHDIDSPAKIRWRHMWSTAVCLPGILFAFLHYLLNLHDRRRGRSSSSTATVPSIDERSAAGAEDAAPATSPNEPRSGSAGIRNETTVVMHVPPSPPGMPSSIQLAGKKKLSGNGESDSSKN